MAFLVYAKNAKYIKILKSLLLKENCLVFDTEFPEAVITMKDPQKFIPQEIKKTLSY